MAFCTNCGRKLDEGTRFCPDCGTATGLGRETDCEAAAGQTLESDCKAAAGQVLESDCKTAAGQVLEHNETDRVTAWLDRYGKFYGIGLLGLGILDYYSDPPILTVFLSTIILIAAAYCLSRKYKLKGFTILAVLLAIICLICGISQGNREGYLITPNYGSGELALILEGEDTDTSEVSKEDIEGSAKKSDGAKKSDSTKKGNSAKKASSSKKRDSAKKAVNGVDPELKEFLDTYESFINDYVSFMKKYSENPGNALAMLADYSDMMTKYADFEEKIADYDTDTMSVADMKYYLEVIDRCNMKIMEMY